MIKKDLQFIPRLKLVSIYELKNENFVFVGLTNFVFYDGNFKKLAVLPIRQNSDMMPKLVKPIIKQVTEKFYQKMLEIGASDNS